MASPGGTLGLLKTLQKRRVSLQKRGWGRLADLGETFYEHQISDDKVMTSLWSLPCLLGVNKVTEARQELLEIVH